jgi:hypothetical protein
MCRRGNYFACGLSALLCCASASAQYTYDPNAQHELDDPSPRFFGAVKDERGALVEGAMVMLDSELFNLVLVTDVIGRFQISVPLLTDPAKVTARCAKAGYSQVRVTRRPGPAGVKPVVQIDCVLRANKR